MSLKRVLLDRVEFRDKEFSELDVFLEERLTVECEKCGQLTDFVITGPDKTYYVHEFTVKGERIECCIIGRGQDFIPDALLYVQGGVLCSTVEACW
jgi:hypothetical protein